MTLRVGAYTEACNEAMKKARELGVYAIVRIQDKTERAVGVVNGQTDVLSVEEISGYDCLCRSQQFPVFHNYRLRHRQRKITCDRILGVHSQYSTNQQRILAFLNQRLCGLHLLCSEQHTRITRRQPPLRQGSRLHAAPASILQIEYRRNESPVLYKIGPAGGDPLNGARVRPGAHWNSSIQYDLHVIS